MAKGTFRVRVISSGLSKNNRLYPADVLRRSVALFEGVRVFVKGDAEHNAGIGKDVRNLIGRLVGAEFVPAGSDAGDIFATMELIDPDSDIARKVIKAEERGMLDLFGLSIDAMGASQRDADGAMRIRDISRVNSVDLIVEPGANGRVINLIEAAGAAEQGNTMDRTAILDIIARAQPGSDGSAPTNPPSRDDILAAIQAVDTSLIPADLSAVDDTALLAILERAVNSTATMTEAVTGRTVRMMQQVNRCTLPAASKERLITDISAGRITEAALTGRIQEEGRYLASLGVGRISGAGLPAGRAYAEDTRAKAARMMDAFFNPADRSVRSIRECYIQITGDRNVTGMVKHAGHVRLSEAVTSTTWADVLGDSITRRMVAEYQLEDIFDGWKDLVTVVPVNDFREQERARWGGYGNLPAVAEAAPYLDMTTPTDEAATYSVTKRGGLETVTLETISNDDVGAVLRVPVKLAQAAKRTISEFVFAFITGNPTIYDGKALFHADHGNLGAVAIGASSVEAGRLAMKGQVEKDSGKKMGIGPRYLWVPDVLERTAFDLFQRGTNIDADFVQSLQLVVKPVWCWTDANDWVLSAETRKVPVIELGFLGGQEEPEVFVQDNPSVGSFFTHDKITYKIRHIYGAAVTDYRGLYKAVVA